MWLPRITPDVPWDTLGNEGRPDRPGSLRGEGTTCQHLRPHRTTLGCPEVIPECPRHRWIPQGLLQWARQAACPPNKGRTAWKTAPAMQRVRSHKLESNREDICSL